MHIIVTMRSKTETVQGEGKKVMKLGMKSEQRDGVEYEFTTVLDLQHESHLATATKDRTRLFMGADPQVITKDTGASLMDWLNSGKADKTITPAQRDSLQDLMAEARLVSMLPVSALNAVCKVCWRSRSQSLMKPCLR